MAGAFVASADDPSALIWNPGGMARATRLAFLADFARFDGSGAGEHLAALVAPSWRWGSLGMALRHRGVDGIDPRDERNVALPGELSAAEIEIALGYGRSVAPGIGLGGAVKLQRSSVGRFSGTGYGADIGVSLEAREILGDRMSWAAPLSMGFAVRNVLEPAQRLDQESVSDPRLVRFGLAWHRLVSGLHGLNVAVGLEHAAGLPARFSAGSEMEVGGTLAFRSGINDGRPAAGTSVRWSGLTVDYAYELRDLGAAHRIGISRAIGPAVSESRAAARLAEERTLAERLDRGYEQRLAEQVTGLLARAEEARATGDLPEALEAVAAARALAPGDSRAARLEALLHREDGARLERAGDSAGAALAYGRALVVSPADSLAAAGQKRARAELARRASRSRPAAGEAGGVDSARAQVEAPPDSSELRNALEHLRRRARERQADAGMATRPTVPPRATGAQRREAEQHFRRGLELASAGRTDNALRFWELALSLDPGHQRARQALGREYLLRGMAAFGRGRFAEAETNWARVVELDPSDVRARSYLERARTQLERTRELTGDGP